MASITSDSKSPYLIISFFESGQYFAIYAKKTGTGVFKWQFSGYSFRGLDIDDANLTVSNFL